MYTNRVGIGVIVYQAVHDTVQCLRSIKLNTRIPYDLVVCDNTESNSTNCDVATSMGASIAHRGTNVGCAVGRNKIFEYFRNHSPGLEFLVIMDQDVRVLPKWLEDMLELSLARKNAGIVAWPCANMGNRPVRRDGCISKAASVCNLHRMQSIVDVGGWDPNFFMYRFDSLFADRLNNAGWRSYIQMKYFQPGVDWDKQNGGGIIHDHPHEGIKRNPNWQKLRAQSDRYYRELMQREGWGEFDPMCEPTELWDLSPQELRRRS